MQEMAQTVRATTAGEIEISLDEVTRILTRHISLYRWRTPVYQTALLGSLAKTWRPGDRRVLDVGGGTGIVAQSIKTLFPVDRVVSVDVHDRYLPSLDIERRTYDGQKLPFADASFDCVVMCNVLHHVPVDARVALLRECGRVAGRIHLKDHLAESPLDHARLTGLDRIGNVPFGGMVEGERLGRADWLTLAEQADFRIEDWNYDRYRRGPMAWLFPPGSSPDDLDRHRDGGAPKGALRRYRSASTRRPQPSDVISSRIFS